MKKEISFKEIGPNHPAYLNQEETENPFLAGHHLADSSSLFTVRKVWWDMMYYAFSSSEADGLPSFTRAELLFVHKAIMKLIEASFLIEKWRLDLKIEEIKTLIKKP